MSPIHDSLSAQATRATRPLAPSSRTSSTSTHALRATASWASCATICTYLGDGTLRSGKTISPHIVSQDILENLYSIVRTSTSNHHPTACEVMRTLDHVNMSGNATDIVKAGSYAHAGSTRKGKRAVNPAVQLKPQQAAKRQRR